MAKTCVLTKDTDGVAVLRNRRQVRFTVTLTTTANDAGASNGETMTTTLSGRSLTVTPSTISATQCTIGQALGLPAKIDFIMPISVASDSLSNPAVAYATQIDPTIALLVLWGTSASTGQLAENATGNIPTGTYTAKFIAQGY